ncbi:hypothetical protein [Hespellia stercorisuis]|uniref:Cro/C1-type HTH DNA-binding domain-containing protein n=1 Tax=Hespellia stercorisuis DSM 15480 TaxID=1121950 RepID=A0A1M6TSR9_9FIRM|nr:hypothetical protein [Hespellia stercorisuis]SHK59950.1 hypothetical protein SAMN02745243_03318 [Hespellia stercorisuis DSM 15480]
MTDVVALRKCIEDSGMTMVFISNKTGMLRETLYNRLSDKKSDFKASEIIKLSDVLGLSNKERDAIFFANESELNSRTEDEAKEVV